MTVAELIANLRRLPSTARVVTRYRDTLVYIDVEPPHIEQLGRWGAGELRYYGKAAPYYGPGGPDQVDMVVID